MPAPKKPKPTPEIPLPTAEKPVTMTVKRYDLIIAVISLLGVIAATTTTLIMQHRQSQRLDLLQASIRDTDELRESLRKPLEGVWEHRIEFSKYFGQNIKYNSSGKAIFVWQAANSNYAVYIGYGIKKEFGSEEVVSGFLTGTLQANKDGWPAEPFEINLRYAHRTGKGDFERVGVETFSFVKGAATPDTMNRSRAGRITLEYETTLTFGKVTISR